MLQRNWRRVLVVVAALLVLGFLLPPLVNVSRFSIVQAMEKSLGRKVTVEAVKLRVLPQPGFDLFNLAIADDPAFGAEPMLRADRVTASLRLTSLWRGRLEVARLSLKSGTDINPPSLNLVRLPDGRWNVEALLQRASQTPSAPTAQTKAEVRPRFPYIEADGGRINFKFGQEKKVHVLSEADFSLWLASEDEWAFRLAARPLRTDVNISDTGILKLNGRFRRAAALRDTPLDVTAVWQGAQLGGMTKLISGQDHGWRGGITTNTRLTGTPAALHVKTEVAVQDFRRYDIASIDPVLLESECAADYSTATDQLSQIECRMPLGKGLILARGSLQGVLEPLRYDLDLSADRVGVQALITLARHVKKDLPDDLAASSGDLNAAVHVSREAGANVWSGSGRISEVTLQSASLSPALSLPQLNFHLDGPGISPNMPKPGVSGTASSKVKSGSRINHTQLDSMRVAVAPFRLALGAAPLSVTAWFSREGYEARLQGDARVGRALQAGRSFGLPVPRIQVDGSAHMDLRLAGTWAGFSAPQITGEAQLRDVSAPIKGLNMPLQIAAASLSLTPERAALQHLNANFPGSPLQFTGWVFLPRRCSSPDQCVLSFDLQTDQLAVDDLNRLLNPRLAKRAWYDVFQSGSSDSVLKQVRGQGRITAGRLSLKSLLAQHVTTDINLQAGKLDITNLRADVLGGHHQGEWHADFTGAQPEYIGTGSVSRVAMQQLATLMRDNWSTGTVDATYRVAMAGSSALQLVASLSGSSTFSWHNGSLRHLTLAESDGPLQFKNYSGQMEFYRGTLKFVKSRMATASADYEISGTASLDRKLDLKVRSRNRMFNVSGRMDKPEVTPAPIPAEAALMP